MQGIGEFFKKIQNARAGEIMARTAVKDAIKRHAGADVPIEQISFKAGVATLMNVSQAARSAIFVKKPAILSELAESHSRRITDIR